MISVVPHCGYLSETSRMLEIHGPCETAVPRYGWPRTAARTQNLLGRAQGVDYDLIEPQLTPARCAELVQSGPGLGPPDQSMWTDDELLAHAEAEASYFRDHDVSVVVTGFTLTTLLSARLAGIRLSPSTPAPSSPRSPSAGCFRCRPDRRCHLRCERCPRTWPAGRTTRGSGPVTSTPPGSTGWPPGSASRRCRAFPAMLLGDLTLVTDLPEVVGVSAEAMEAWRPAPGSPYRPSTRLAYAGPIHAHLDVPMPTRAEALLTAPGATVYVAMTSTPPDLVRAVVADLVSTADWQVLVAGTVHDVADLEALAPGRVVVEGVLPSHLVLPRVGAAVVTGGQGSVQAALSSGTPFVGIPLHAEQDLNVHLAAQLGAAVVQPVQSIVGGVGPDVARVLADPSFRAAAGRWAARYAEVDGPGLAADRIIALHAPVSGGREVAPAYR